MTAPWGTTPKKDLTTIPQDFFGVIFVAIGSCMLLIYRLFWRNLSTDRPKNMLNNKLLGETLQFDRDVVELGSCIYFIGDTYYLTRLFGKTIIKVRQKSLKKNGKSISYRYLFEDRAAQNKTLIETLNKCCQASLRELAMALR